MRRFSERIDQDAVKTRGYLRGNLRVRAQFSRIRVVLAALLVVVFVLNTGFIYLAFELSGDSHPERLDEYQAQIERGEIEVTKERFLSVLSNMKQYAIASDQLVSTFQKVIALLAIANIVVVTAVGIWLWQKANMEQSPQSGTDHE